MARLNITNPFAAPVQPNSGFSLMGRTTGPATLGGTPGIGAILPQAEIAQQLQPQGQAQQGPTRGQLADLAARRDQAFQMSQSRNPGAALMGGIASIVLANRAKKLAPYMEEYQREQEELQTQMAKAKLQRGSIDARQAQEQMDELDRMKALNEARTLGIMGKDIDPELAEKANLLTTNGRAVTFGDMIEESGYSPKMVSQLKAFDPTFATALQAPVSRRDDDNEYLRNTFQNARKQYQDHVKFVSKLNQSKVDSSLDNVKKIIGLFDKLSDNITRADLVMNPDDKQSIVKSNLDMMKGIQSYAKQHDLPLSMRSWETLAAGQDLLQYPPDERQARFFDLAQDYQKAIQPMVQDQRTHNQTNSKGAVPNKKPTKINVAGGGVPPKAPSSKEIKAKRDAMLRADPTLADRPDQLAMKLRQAFNAE